MPINLPSLETSEAVLGQAKPGRVAGRSGAHQVIPDLLLIKNQLHQGPRDLIKTEIPVTGSFSS